MGEKVGTLMWSVTHVVLNICRPYLDDFPFVEGIHQTSIPEEKMDTSGLNQPVVSNSSVGATGHPEQVNGTSKTEVENVPPKYYREAEHRLVFSHSGV